MKKAQAKFEERLYGWVLGEWKQEISNNFPILRSSKEISAENALVLLDSLEKGQQWVLAKTLAKRSIKKHLHLWGEEFTEKDKELERFYIEELRRIRNEKASKGPILTSELYFKEESQKVKQKELRKCIENTFSTFIDMKCEDNDRGIFFYRTSIGIWNVWTVIDAGSGGSIQLNYSHFIDISLRERLIEDISFTSWLGISGPATWFRIYKSDAESVVQFLANIIKHFLGAVPKLLEGLLPND